MGAKMFALVFLLIWLSHLFSVDAQATFVNITGCVPKNGNYTGGSIYQQNLDILFTDLSSQTLVKKFFNTTVGDGPNKVYGLYQCREDVSLSMCDECIQEATQKIVEVCPLNAEATVWYYECMLRYANRSIFSLSEKYPAAFLWSKHLNVSNYGEFSPVFASEINRLIPEAVVGTSAGHFAVGEANWTAFERVYCLVQCTPDIDEFGCNSCLRSALSDISGCCIARARVMIFKPSCHLRYDTTEKFYFDVNPESPTPPPSNNTDEEETSNNPSNSTSRLKTPIIVAIVVGAAVGFALLLIALWLCTRPSKQKQASMTAPTQAPSSQGQKSEVEGDAADNFDKANNFGDNEFVQYDFATLKAATGDFSSNNKLGEGGFGAVYKGTLNSGEVVAIKRLLGNSGQGTKEFMTEASLVAKLQHRNLVKLTGFCSEPNEKLLVYEFLPNSSVDRFLFDPIKRASLVWETRYKIIMGIARGLQYLHEDSRLTIIHRDLKPSNILLDKDMNPKIADFGMAKLFGGEQKHGNTSRIVGTYGYMAPEYMLTGEYSEKSDVYSFGIIILELVTGEKNRLLYNSPQKEDIPIQAWKLWNAGQSIQLLDPSLTNRIPRSEVMRCIQIGLLCVQGNVEYRPTMADVVLMLTGHVALPSPSMPITSLHHFSTPRSDNLDSRRQNELYQTMSKSVSLGAEMEQDLYPR